MFNDDFRETVRRFPTRPAIVSEDGAIDYQGLWDRSCRLANLLADAGIKPGDRISSLGRNSLSSMEDMTASALGGFVRSSLYMQDTPARQAFMLRRAGVRALLVDADVWPALEAELAKDGGPPMALVLTRKGVGVADCPYEQALRAASNADPMITEDPDALYMVRFSAGTTGMPKPIAHSRRAYEAANMTAFSQMPPFDENDVYLAVSPYSHGSGNLVWPVIAGGGAHLVMKGSFDADRAHELIERHGATTLFLVPTMIQRLLDSPRCKDTDLSSIRRIIYGAAPIPHDLIDRAIDRFGDVLCQLYGQSEIVPITVLSAEDHRSEDPEIRFSAGRVPHGCGVRIESLEGEILPPRQVGEVVGTGPGMMTAIFGDPDATRERFTEDGWIRTRDLGWLREDGYLHIVDRVDDMIISGGFNIAPSEIEDALNRHGDVIEAVAFGVPHPTWGATPVAVVRLRTEATADAASLGEWCRAAIGPVKKPSTIIISPEPLPINSAGKLMRRVVRDMYAGKL